MPTSFFTYEFEKIAKMTKIDHLVAESLIHVKNVNSLAKLAQARGAMLSAFDAPDIKFFEYSPNKVKQRSLALVMRTKKRYRFLLNAFSDKN